MDNCRLQWKKDAPEGIGKNTNYIMQAHVASSENEHEKCQAIAEMLHLKASGRTPITARSRMLLHSNMNKTSFGNEGPCICKEGSRNANVVHGGIRHLRNIGTSVHVQRSRPIQWNSVWI